MEADIEQEDIDVVRGAPALAISEFESEGFFYSENVRRKIFPQYEFFNFQHLTLLFFGVSWWPDIDFFWVSYAARAETWSWLREACVFLVYDSSAEPIFNPHILKTSRTDVSGSEIRVDALNLEEDVWKKNAIKKSVTAVHDS